jgi:hypothetical protein
VIGRVVLLVFALLTLGCSQSEPELPKERVDYNSFEVTLVPEGFQTSIKLEYKDLDRDGNAELISQAVLKPNTAYDATTRYYLEENGFRTDVTAEVLRNFAAYTICYDPGILDILIQRTDDSGTDVLGLTTRWETRDASEGSVLVTTAYQPADTDVDCRVGEIQSDVAFVINVRTGNSPN